MVWIFRFFSNETAPNCASVGNLLIVGDDQAFGFGDSIFKKSIGIASYLPFYLNKERKLKTNWKIYNFGYWATSSRDWLPSSKSGLFSRIKVLLEDRSCSIVLLFIGGNDANFKITAQESISNIKSICSELSNLKALIFISTLPTWGDEGLSSDLAKIRSDFNSRIKKMVNSQEILGLNVGVDLGANNFEYRVLNLYIRDGMHFSSAVRLRSVNSRVIARYHRILPKFL